MIVKISKTTIDSLRSIIRKYIKSIYAEKYLNSKNSDIKIQLLDLYISKTIS